MQGSMILIIEHACSMNFQQLPMQSYHEKKFNKWIYFILTTFIFLYIRFFAYKLFFNSEYKGVLVDTYYLLKFIQYPEIAILYFM